MGQQLDFITPHVSDAIFSPCRTWRYALWRQWNSGKGTVAFCGLNCSTADETKNDPTVRRCIGYAQAWGYSGMVMLNLFAFRATLPEDMKAAKDPIGPENDKWLKHYYEETDITLAAWGSHGKFMNRSSHVRYMLGELHCLSINRDGEPGHPLYLKKTLKPKVFLG